MWKGYDIHLIFYELKNYDVKIDVIPNGLEKHMVFILNKNLVFSDSMQFMNSSLEKLLKNLSENDFKYLTEEFSSKNLEPLKQKDARPYEYTDSLERVCEEKLSDKICFYGSLEDGATDDNGKKLDGHVSDEEYLTCIKIWNKSGVKDMCVYHDHYL